MFKFVIYRENKIPWTSQIFDSWDKAEELFDIQMKNLNGTGGNILQYINKTIGWVLFNENPEDD